MTIIQAIILAVVQGASEFLPISSSGHLAIIYHVLAIPEPTATYAILVHAGTLVATLVYFRQQLLALFSFSANQLLTKALWASLPAALLGITLYPVLNNLFESKLILALGFFGTGLTLFRSRFPDQNQKKIKNLSSRECVIIGLFQAAALIPGFSRSGSTIYASFKQGLSHNEAFFFSFLLFIPASLGALALTVVNENLTRLPTSLIIIAITVPALVGYLSLASLQKLLNRQKLYLLFPYGFLLAAVSLLL